MPNLGKTSKKRKFSKKSKYRKKPKPSKPQKNLDPNPQFDSGSDSDDLTAFLEAYSKPQLVDLICDAAVRDPAVLRHLHDLADRDVAHRKIFIYGLAWDTSQEHLRSAFFRFGELEECHVVIDKATGKSKGYGFVLFGSRKEATRALKNPQKMINNRVSTCQLACPTAKTSSGSSFVEKSERKLYVGNVPLYTDVGSLRDFFAKFGEIEEGPIGFNYRTGKFRGFALFVYKTLEGFQNALREPNKMFEGQPLYCQKAAESSGKPKVGGEGLQQPPPMGALPMPNKSFEVQQLYCQKSAESSGKPKVEGEGFQQPPPPPMGAIPMLPNMAFFNPMMYGGFVPGSVNPMGMIPAPHYGGYAVNGIHPGYPHLGGPSNGAVSFRPSF